jgi:hypothetical protein
MKLVILSPPVPYRIPRTSKYLPHHLTLKHPNTLSLRSFLAVTDQISLTTYLLLFTNT